MGCAQGYNLSGQLGDGGTSSSSVPVAVVGGGAWIAISAGWQHSCGIKSDRSAWCWGANNQGGAIGTLGHGNTSANLSTTPVRVTSAEAGSWGYVLAAPPPLPQRPPPPPQASLPQLSSQQGKKYVCVFFNGDFSPVLEHAQHIHLHWPTRVHMMGLLHAHAAAIAPGAQPEAAAGTGLSIGVIVAITVVAVALAGKGCCDSTAGCILRRTCLVSTPLAQSFATHQCRWCLAT
jgi:hypothetical protein